MVVPLPNWPWALAPQHLVVPSASNAHVWFSPALSATALARPVTTTGVDVLVVVPLPNWPKALAPQHLAVPFPSNAHEWLPPAPIATAVGRAAKPLSATGVDAFVVVMFPNSPEPLTPQQLA